MTRHLDRKRACAAMAMAAGLVADWLDAL